uniref:LRAT domain-containing protein n=1 Tax=Gouania willdenowi TaxID=441366 RepID=A0A8C5DQA3_GOUWI
MAFLKSILFCLIHFNNPFRSKPKAGDCIEIFRGNYQHWALYVGDGCVVHLAPPCNFTYSTANKMASVLCEKALVQKNGLWDVVGNHEWRVNNDLDKKYEHRPVQVIVRDALDVVGCELPYNIVARNCEHFVNELRYGKAESRQVSATLKLFIYLSLFQPYFNAKRYLLNR